MPNGEFRFMNIHWISPYSVYSSFFLAHYTMWWTKILLRNTQIDAGWLYPTTEFAKSKINWALFRFESAGSFSFRQFNTPKFEAVLPDTSSISRRGRTIYNMRINYTYNIPDNSRPSLFFIGDQTSDRFGWVATVTII